MRALVDCKKQLAIHKNSSLCRDMSPIAVRNASQFVHAEIPCKLSIIPSHCALEFPMQNFATASLVLRV